MGFRTRAPGFDRFLGGGFVEGTGSVSNFGARPSARLTTSLGVGSLKVVADQLVAPLRQV